MGIEDLIPKFRNTPVFASAERIFQSSTDFIRGNPLVSTASIGAGFTGLVAVAAVVGKRRKASKKRKTTKKRTTKRKSKKRSKKKTKTQIKAMRCRNLAKARKARKRGIIRGPGLGRREIKHSGRGTKGKHKVVSFRNKKTGKIVRFKARR